MTLENPVIIGFSYTLGILFINITSIIEVVIIVFMYFEKLILLLYLFQNSNAEIIITITKPPLPPERNNPVI